jgi:ATP-dependent Clp protease ATP-binding subunit ClpB
VILFDEVEKAHADVFNVLLQVLDDGRLTDGQGRTVDFRNTVIILTSNLGTEYLSVEGGETREAKLAVMTAVRAHFRPEFLNRLDEIILFHRLTRQNMDKIVTIQLGRLEKLLADRKIEIALDKKATEWLANAGYDPVYGARPLKRVIQRRLQDPLAQMLLEGTILDGAKVMVSAGKNGLIIDGKEFAGPEDEFDTEHSPQVSRAVH